MNNVVEILSVALMVRIMDCADYGELYLWLSSVVRPFRAKAHLLLASVTRASRPGLTREHERGFSPRYAALLRQMKIVDKVH